VRRPPGALPRVPAGFVVDLLTTKVSEPRMIRTAPNGDVFVVESGAGRVKVVRGADRDAGPERIEVFATGLRQPFGIGFYPPDAPRWVYVANTDSVVPVPVQRRRPGGARPTRGRGRRPVGRRPAARRRPLDP